MPPHMGGYFLKQGKFSPTDVIRFTFSSRFFFTNCMYVCMYNSTSDSTWQKFTPFSFSRQCREISTLFINISHDAVPFKKSLFYRNIHTKYIHNRSVCRLRYITKRIRFLSTTGTVSSLARWWRKNLTVNSFTIITTGNTESGSDLPDRGRWTS
jgi:hypothetical protein